MKRQRRKGIAGALALTVALGCFLPAAPVYAEEGWTKQGDEWSYLNRNDTPMTNVWKKSKENWYYLGEDGHIVRNGIVTWRDYDYYVDADGKMQANAWIWIDGSGSGDDVHEEGWRYFGADGKGYKKKNKSFRKEIDGKYYVFDEEGVMLTGFIDENGEAVEEDDPFVEGRYFAGQDGALYTGQWLNYGGIGTADGIGGSGLESAVSGRSYSDYPEMWMYFGADSKKYRSRGGSPLQKEIGGATYGFDENGIMLSWWGDIASLSDAVRSNPTTVQSVKYYDGYDGGPLMKNKWLWMFPSEKLSEDDFIDLESSWWRTDAKGRVYRNRIKEVNGRRYAFDGIGRMQTGFMLFGGKDEFVAQYDVDAWDSKDFIEGNLYGIEKADLYLFGPDELNDGSMKSGKEIEVELADGVYTFGFAPNGKAYGNRNYLQKRGGKYYINGLRLEADEGFGYGVVKAEKNGADYYQVVDERGKVVTGRKALKDRDGGYLLIIGDRFVAYCGDEFAPRWRNGDKGPGFYHYDKDNKEDHYAEGLIAGSDTPTAESGLPAEECLNF